MGDTESHYDLSLEYQKGRCVEKDTKKAISCGTDRHWWACLARYNLGATEEGKGNFDKAVKHFIIAANLGYGGSIEKLKKCYARGMVSKEDFAAVLRAHQAAVDATKSPQRDAAEAARKR